MGEHQAHTRVLSRHAAECTDWAWCCFLSAHIAPATLMFTLVLPGPVLPHLPTHHECMVVLLILITPTSSRLTPALGKTMPEVSTATLQSFSLMKRRAGSWSLLASSLQRPPKVLSPPFPLCSPPAGHRGEGMLHDRYWREAVDIQLRHREVRGSSVKPVALCNGFQGLYSHRRRTPQ